MRTSLAGLALGLMALQSAGPARAQEADDAAQAPVTAEEVIEAANERLRAPGLRKPCKMSENPNEIVVCARDPDALRVESPTDEAIRTKQPGRDPIPRAPDLVPPCPGCKKIGRDPEPPLIVDLTHMPVGLTEDEARQVYRVEDRAPADDAPDTPAPRP